MKDEIREKVISTCRETAKTLGMSKRGSRWLSEVTEVTLKNQNIIEYGFYILDKKTGNEYEAKAIVQNNDNANWTVKFVQ
jgi:hypothetical protein